MTDQHGEDARDSAAVPVRGWPDTSGVAREWLDASMVQRARFDEIGRDPANIAFVRERARNERHRTVDVPVRCGDHDTGYFVALAMRSDGALNLVYSGAPGVTVDPAASPAWELGPRGLDFECPVCGVRTPSRNAVWVLEETFRALRKNSDGAAIHIRT